MATLATYNLTLSDVAKQTTPKGQIADIVMMLEQTNDIIQDMNVIECNDGTSHETCINTGLPQGSWVKYNVGRVPAKGTTQQVRAQTGILEMPSVLDKYLAEKRGPAGIAKLRFNQMRMAIEGLNQQMATALFYEDERTNPERFTGLAPHYSTVNTSTAASAENVIDGGGTGSDNMSVWIVGWGDNQITGLLQEGHGVGIKIEDRGIVDVVDSTGIAGATFLAYKEILNMRMGILPVDWRYGVRICNIDVSNLVAESSNADLWKLIIRGLNKIPNLKNCRPAIYGNRTFRTWLEIQALNKSAYQTTYKEVAGEVLYSIRGVPLRVCDALLNTEARIV